MKKKLLCAGMVLSMLTAMLPAAVYAEEPLPAAETEGSEDAEWKETCLQEYAEVAEEQEDMDVTEALHLMDDGLSLFDFGDRNFREAEPNNRPGYADIVQHDFTVLGSLATDDIVDYFVFELKEESHVNIMAIAEKEESLVFTISDKDNHVLHASVAIPPSNDLYADAVAVTLPAGKYYICFLDLKNPSVALLEYKFYTEITSVKDVSRVYGTSRCDTAMKAADTLMEVMDVKELDAVIVANAENFADALAGSYLAAKKDAPILLTNLRSEAAVQEYINKNLKDGGTVYILGGPLAVASSFETGLDSSFDVERLYGTSRYDTNLAILKAGGLSGSEEILVCTGTNFADSLSVSATGKPILLVGNSLTANQKEFLQESSGDFTIIGGPLAVNEKIESELNMMGFADRIFGTSRFDTSVAVAEAFFDKPEAMVLAYAQNFPDGLSGGPLAYQLDAPLVLTQNGKHAAAMTYAQENALERGYVMGGTMLISDKTVREIFDLSTQDVITVK